MRTMALILLVPAAPSKLSWPQDALDWMSGLSAHPMILAQAALISLAFLLALLTVIATWEIPPAKTLPNRPQPTKEGEAGTDAKVSTATAGAGIAIFQSNFGRTVLSGLGGMVAVSLIDEAFWKAGKIESKPHYLVLFILFFLSILLFSAVYQGVVEALRSRVVLGRRPLARSKTEDRFFLYWGRRFWRWALSWRSAGLIFLDTVFNVIQGRNQLQTAGFGKAILNLHLSQVWTANRIRKEVDDAVLRTLWKPEVKRIWTELGAEPPEDEDIRASISVLSEDGLSVSYLSREEGSLGVPFGQHSIAWVSVASGVARWLRRSSRQESWNTAYNDQVVLLKDREARLPGEGGDLKLGPYLENRRAQDYEGFVVLPVPWLREDVQERQRAAIHISFRDARYMDALWKGLELKGQPNYDDWRGLLECHTEEQKHHASPDDLVLRDPELAAVLRESVDVLGELLRFFNPRIFEEQVLPQLKAA